MPWTLVFFLLLISSSAKSIAKLHESSMILSVSLGLHVPFGIVMHIQFCCYFGCLFYSLFFLSSQSLFVTF